MPLGQPGSSRSMRPPRADQAADLPIRATLEVLLLESTVLWASSTALLGEEGRLSDGGDHIRRRFRDARIGVRVSHFLQQVQQTGVFSALKRLHFS